MIKKKAINMLYKIRSNLYLIKKKNIQIGKNIKINQKTIFSGKGKIIVSDNVKIGYRIGGYFHNNVSEFQARYEASQIKIKDNVAINNSCFFLASNLIEIGKNSRIGSNVTMMDYEAHGTKAEDRSKIGKIGTIVIGENVWIGNNSIILKNVNIGRNSIVAAGSVVLKGDYPENCILGGNPAKVIKEL